MADRTQVFRGADSQWYWHRKAPNNRIIATGGEGFTTKAHAERAADRAFPAPPSPWPYILTAFLLGLLIGLCFYAAADTSHHQQPATTTTAPAAAAPTVSTEPLTTPATVTITSAPPAQPSTTAPGAPVTATTLKRNG